jgi:hypothetical protein
VYGLSSISVNWGRVISFQSGVRSSGSVGWNLSVYSPRRLPLAVEKPHLVLDLQRPRRGHWIRQLLVDRGVGVLWLVVVDGARDWSDDG